MSVVKITKPGGQTAQPSANGMDRVIARKPWWRRRATIGVAVLALTVAAAGFAVLRFDGQTQRVPADSVTIATVGRGIFDDYVPVRARATPLTTVFLDAVEGGRVEQILVEDGTSVRKGQLIAVLSNSALQLQVIAREAEVTEQLNNLRSQELQLERNALEHRRNLVEINWNLDKLQRQFTREQTLSRDGWVADSKFADTKAELDYYRNRRTVTLEAQATDARLERTQLAQLRLAADQLQRNLQLARANLDSLNVRAPVDGQLSAFSIEVGQSLAAGERIGQIDSIGRSKLVAEVDEFYLNRVSPGQQATAETEGGTLPLKLAKIYPQVRNGTFQVDMTFTGKEPPVLRRGQTLDIKLALGDPTPALLIPNGSFYADTGGQWVFVASPDGRSAQRRTVKLGRRNVTQIEVLDGLQPGERVITSPYTGLSDKTRLELSL